MAARPPSALRSWASFASNLMIAVSATTAAGATLVLGERSIGVVLLCAVVCIGLAAARQP